MTGSIGEYEPDENRQTNEVDPGPAPKKPGRAGAFLFLTVLLVTVLLLFIGGFLPRLARKAELKTMHDETVGAVPVVHAITAHPARQTEAMTLPGNIGAIQYTTIYARVDGYLKSRLVDIGDQVKQGQLLAEIDTPTVDEKLEQAKADLLEAKAQYDSTLATLKQQKAKQLTAEAAVEKAQANVQYATITAKRWEDMCTRGSVSQQSRDEKVRLLDTTTAELKEKQANLKAAIAEVEAAEASVRVAAATIKAKDADVKRLAAEQNFKHVVAPFDGVITLRKVDPGALITQGSQTSTLELFQMAKIDALRIYVNAPQRIARYLKNGMTADINVPEFPDRKFIGVVTNVSGALDPNTRTRQTEIKIDNKDHALLPGMYAEVTMTALREEPWIRVPGTTLVTRNDGMYVVIVKDVKAHYQKIQVGRDFGNEVEVKSGLLGGEHVVISPSDDLREGEPVQMLEAPPATT